MKMLWWAAIGVGGYLLWSQLKSAGNGGTVVIDGGGAVTGGGSTVTGGGGVTGSGVIGGGGAKPVSLRPLVKPSAALGNYFHVRSYR